MIVQRVPAVSRGLIVTALLALLPFTTPPVLIVSLVLLGLNLSNSAKRPALFELYVAMLTTIGLTFVMSAVWPATLVPVLLVIPGLPWLESAMRRAAAGEGDASAALRVPTVRLPRSRWATSNLLALIEGLVAVAIIGVVVPQWVLFGAAVALAGFLGILITVACINFPQGFLEVRMATVRVLARNPVQATVGLSSKARLPARVVLEGHHKTRIVPRAFTIGANELLLTVTLTPPLAGPAMVSATATVVDPWGLTAAREVVNLVHLHVIPRGAYAAWLAQRYLEQARAGALASGYASEGGPAEGTRRGLEFSGARLYEPGDAPRDIFWKRTLKLNQLVVKERRGGYGETVILIASLIAQTPESMDLMAYKLVVSTMTLAQEGVPVAFATYTNHDIVRVTPPLGPRAATLEALGLIKHLQVMPTAVRVLQPPKLAWLRQHIARLRANGAEPSRRLARLLTFEYESILQRARRHPSGRALMRAAAMAPSPTAIVILSSNPEEATSLELALHDLRVRGFHVIQLPEAHRGSESLFLRVPPERGHETPRASGSH